MEQERIDLNNKINELKRELYKIQPRNNLDEKNKKRRTYTLKKRRIHQENEDYVCKICSKLLSAKQALDRHNKGPRHLKSLQEAIIGW